MKAPELGLLNISDELRDLQNQVEELSEELLLEKLTLHQEYVE